MRPDSFPRYQTGSGWNALLPERQPLTRMPVERHVDTAVIGAGYTGLAAARRVAELEPNRTVLLLDAGEIGEGASGRNSGFLGVAPQQPLANRHGDAAMAATRQMRIYRAGVAWLRSLVEAHGIACNWNEAMPRFHAAATPAGARRIAEMIERYNNWGLNARAVDQDELERRIGTRYYRAGMTYGDYAFVQPAALVRGLAAALPGNVTLVERMPVESVTGGGPYRLMMPAGEITADRVIIASNAHARSFGLLKGRLFAIYTHGGMTPVLPAEELAKLGEEPLWGVLPAHQLGTTSRKVEGGRFLIRAGDSYEAQPDTKAIRKLLTKLYRNRYPGMASYDLEHVWTGVTAITGNGGLYFGELRKGLFCAAGCNGSGVVRGSINGKLLAEMACGSQSKLLSDRLSLKGPNWLPPEPARRIGVTTTIAVQALFAGNEI
jgi:glycine/D-amino acid oxidase-like deaminating enzyme